MNIPHTHQTAVYSHGRCIQILIRPRCFVILTVLHLLWLPCVADADIIFLPCGFFFFFFFLA